MLTPQQSEILRAVLDRIIPPDDFPGACEARVEDYISGQFDRDFRDLKDIYRQGLDAIDAESRSESGLPFPLLPSDSQDALLTQIETGKVTVDWPVDPSRFFHMLIEHAMEGYYADEGNGGNRGGVSWKMVGFEVNG